MSEPPAKRRFPFRLSLKALLASTFAASLCVATCARMVSEAERARRLIDPLRWPPPIRALWERSPEIADSIKVYDRSFFVDRTMAVSISGHREVVVQFVRDNGLLETDATHPYSKWLVESLPRDWKKPQPSYKWHTSPGFGSVHQEGVDLFLLATDPQSGDTVMLYVWVF